MSFKENLKMELDYKNVKVKELAMATGISRRTIDQYLATASKMPSAENAVKIAKTLNVSVEYLVTGSEFQKNPNDKLKEQDLVKLCKKYYEIIENLENLSEEKQNFVKNMIRDLKKL